MSARSRYLDAISPKSNTSENNNEFSNSNNNRPIKPNNYTNTSNNTTNTYNNKNISTRNKLLATAPPPPPPPGPPPKRVNSNKFTNNKVGGSQRTFNNNVNNSGNSNRPVIKYTGDPSINNNQVTTAAPPATNSESSNNVPQNNSAPPSTQPHLSEGKEVESSPAKKGGSIWSPKNEAQSGSVKSMTQKLWGSKVSSPKKSTGPKVGSKIAAAQQSMQNSGLGLGLDSRHAAQIHPDNSRQGSGRVGPSLGGRTESGHIDNSRALSPPRSQQQASPSNYLRPPATPPRHTNSGYQQNLTESPKYKRNAPPILASTGNEPSSASNQRIISPNRVGGPRAIHQGTPSPSLLERRRMANNLNLTPVDTSFGNNKKSSQQPYVGASHSIVNQNSIDSREVVKPTNSTIEGSIGLNASGNLLSPRHLTDTRQAYSYGASMSGSFDRGSSYHGSPTESNNNLRSPEMLNDTARQGGSGYQRSDTAKISNVQGNDISTLTAFKRPGTKVGIVFTRLSSNHPEVAVISKILPESIFSRHSLSGSPNGKLEGAQIIAVNGMNVNDPRHAAELVARATEEVRLTVKKRPLSSVWDNQGQGGSSPTSGSGDYGGGKRASTEAALSSPHKLQRSVNASTKSQEGIELDTYGVPRTRSRGDESELSVRTEEGDDMASDARAAPQAAQGYSGAVSTAAATSTSRSNMTSTTAMTPKSAEIAERRRKVAQAMLLSEELVEDPIKEENDIPVMQLNRSSDSASLEMGIEQTFSEGYPDKSVVTAASSSATPSGVSGGGASAADKRRQAALEMYHSDIMVADNVDDEQLGTIEVVSPSSKQQSSSPTINAANLATIDAASEDRDTIGLMPGGSLSRMNKPPSEAGSTTRTDITTSSAVTERMGGSSPAKRSGRGPPSSGRDEFTFDSSGAEVAAASRLVANTSLSPTSSTDSGSSSPAKRRMQRAAQRQAGIASSDRDTPSRIKLPLSPSSGVSSPVMASKSLASSTPAKPPPASTQLSPGMSSVQSNEDSVAVSHVTTASSVAASSAARRSDVSFGNRSTRSALRFGRKKAASSGQSVASVDTTSSSSKKKKGIFGVAKMIRKASSKKSKSRGISLDDDMFDEAAEEESPSVMSGSQMSAKSPGVVSSPVEEVQKGEQEAMSMPPPLMDASPGKAASQAGSADPFATPKSPVGGGDDSGWANSDFFKDDPFGASSPFGTSTGEDAFGFPSTNNDNDDAFFPAGSWGEPSAVDYTPKNSDQQSFDYDEATETSEITNPTYASAAVKSQATNKPKPVDAPEDDSSASTPVNGGKDSLKYAKKSRGGVRLPPPSSSQADGRDDDDQGRGTPTTTPAMAKSRILSKYSKGKTRRQQANVANTSLGTIHSMDDDETDKNNTSMSSARSIGSTSTSNSLKKKRAMQAATDSTPVRSNSPVKQQQVINPATTSALANRRRGGRMSPVRTDNATLNKASSPLRGSPTNKYLSPTRKNRASPSVVDNPSYYSMESRLDQIKDPIQRAGVRLLWAAAIPIQTQARRFLARQTAIRRMCAVLTIQAFVRRWLAERDLEIAIWSAIQIQSTFRGWFARDSLEDNHYCATQIQRVVRGYLATMHVFEDLYSITIVQSVVRMHLSINDAVDRLSSIIAIQAWWRGIKTRDDIEEMDYSAVAIQANWRRYLGQMSYQFDIIDIIIVQSVARRWKTRRDLAAKRIQCLTRVVIAKKRFQQKKGMQSLVTRHTSATKIAARWRAHAAQMQLLHELSAMKIQSCWRSYTAQVHMLISIVNVIVIQSLWRRRAAMKLYKPLLKRIKLAKDRKKTNAATTIQSAWRGFVVYSEYLIKRYENKAAVTIQAHWRGYWQLTSYSLVYCEIVKVQALVRGHQERSWQEFQKECATIIQAAGRRFLARKEVHNECMVSILIAAAANSLRVRNAAGKIQHWWMAEMWQRREKCAALVIERFFIYVKKEVEKEIKALKKKKKAKRRQRKMKQSDDYILERAWLGVAEDTAAAAPMMPAPQQQQRAMPSQMKAYNNKQDRYNSRGVIQTVDEDQQSEVSGLTDLDFGRSGGRKMKSQREFEEDNSLEAAFRDSEAQMSRGGHRTSGKKSNSQSKAYSRRY